MNPIDLLNLISFPPALLASVAWNDINRANVSVDGFSRSISVTVERRGRMDEMRFYKKPEEGWVKL